MPIRPKRKLVTTRQQQIDELLYGVDLFTGSPASVFRDEKERRAIWREHKSDILAMYVQTNPGHRPQVWWDYDAPEPKQVLGEAVWIDTKGEKVFYDVIEDDLEYLERLNLWFPGERDRVISWLYFIKNRNKKLIEEAEKHMKQAQSGNNL